MNNAKYQKPRDGARCVICGDHVTFATPFCMSKPRLGKATIFAHTECLEKEKRGGDET